MALTNELLERYFRNCVQMSRDETKTSVEIVMPIINKILKEINGKDKRFSGESFKAGSHWQNLKVDRADEFDISVPLCALPTSEWVPYTPRYFGFDKEIEDPPESIPADVKVVSKGVSLPRPPDGYCSHGFKYPKYPIWRNSTDMIVDDNLVPFLVKRGFHKLLVETVRDLDEVRMVRRVNGPALTIRVEKEDHFPLSVDFSVINEGFIPFPSSIQWPHRNAKWPSEAKIEDVRRLGVQLVAKKNFDWMVSFVKAEKKLVENIDMDGGCRKRSHRIMKKLSTDVWCNTSKPVITSYCLKNILFWECEEYPHYDQWSGDKLKDRVTSMIRRVERAARDGQLRMYFNPAVNLLQSKERKDLEEALQKILNFMESPSAKLEKILAKSDIER